MTSDWLDVLREACDELGQAEVGRRIGYSRSAICRILRGNYKANTDTIKSLVIKTFGGGKIMDIPEGYMQDSLGRLVPVDTIKPIDLDRDMLVLGIIEEAEACAKALGDMKLGILADIEAFVEASAKEYGVKMGGIKGNVTLTSFDGRYKIQRAMADCLVFDERLQVAKQLVNECIREWVPGSRVEIQALINDAFQVDTEGRINTARILSLRRLDIKDDKWRTAMEAISDSLQVAGSRTYVRIYRRVGLPNKYEKVNLDMSAA